MKTAKDRPKPQWYILRRFDLCECGSPWGTLHTCNVMPRMDTPDMMGTEDGNPMPDDE